MSGFVWFAAVVGGWVGHFALIFFSEPTLGDLQERVRDLPLVVEGIVWLLFFPYVLAVTIWESSWAEWLRYMLVSCCAVGWSLAFYPWLREAERRERAGLR